MTEHVSPRTYTGIECAPEDVARSRPLRVILFSAWLCGWLVTWPALLAHTQSLPITCEVRADSFRGDMAFAMGVSVAPPMWFVAPFVTNLYSDGWRMQPQSCPTKRMKPGAPG